MKIVTHELLDQLTAAAHRSPRLRQNHNLHPADDSRCQRLLNAIEPLSYIRPHRHLDPEKDEAFVLVRGQLGVISFTAAGVVAQTVRLSHGGGSLAVDIPHGVYHTAVSLESGTVFFESKGGPYLSLTEEEKAPWAPVDGDPVAPVYLEQLRRLFT